MKSVFKQYLDIIDKTFIISETDLKGIITYCNENFAKISKYRPEEIIGKPHSLVRHPDTPKETFKELWDTIKRGEIWMGLLKNRAKDGSPYYVKTVIAPIKDEKGENIYYVSFRQDVTELEETKQKLQIEKKFIEAILDNSNNIIILTKNDKIIAVNKKFYEILPFEDFENLEIKDIFDKKCIYKEWDETLKEDQKVCITDKNNSPKVFNVFLNEFTFENKTYKVYTLSDITEIEEARRQAEENQKIKEIFLANISHEMRTPLNSIIGFTELLKKTNLNQTQKNYLKYIEESSKFLLDIVNEILDFSKIEANKLPIEKIPANIYENIMETYHLVLPLAKKKGIELILDIKNLNEGYIFDPIRLKQILTNLLTNAIKFTDKGFVKLQIDGLNFKIIDTGIGIEKSKLEKIFNPFEQAEANITRKYGGTGLGLSITKKLIELLGGKIKVTSEVGKGTIFEFSLDLEPCDFCKLSQKIDGIKIIENRYEKEIKEFFKQFCEIGKGIVVTTNEKIAIEENGILIGEECDKCVSVPEENYLYELYYTLYNFEEKAEKFKVKKGKILIADDYEFNRIYIYEFLKDFDLKFRFAKNGKEALNQALKEDFDLILMDVNMPKLNGIEAAKLIKKEKNIPIIAMTAYATKEEIEELKKYFDDYITKPIDNKILVEKINKFLSQNQAIKYSSQTFKISLEDSHKLYKEFLKSTKNNLKELEEALKNENFEEIERYFHTIKGSSGYFGLNEISETALKGMEKAQKKKLPVEEFKKMKNEIEQLF